MRQLDETLAELRSTLDLERDNVVMARSEIGTLASHNEDQLRQTVEYVAKDSVPQIPVYNVLIGPNRPDTRKALLDNTKTTIRFFIGQPHIKPRLGNLWVTGGLSAGVD